MKFCIKIFFLFLIPFYSCGQSIRNMQTNEIKKLLCHKWNISKNIGSSQNSKDTIRKEIIVFPAELNATVDFAVSGIVNFNFVKGSWKYIKKNNQLIVELNKKASNYNILKITKSEMLLVQDENGVLNKISLRRED